MQAQRLVEPVQHLPERTGSLVFEDPGSRALLRRIERLAATDATVLVTGETGTGKEIVSRYLHQGSARARAPFVAVNCSALAPTLFESELFGHEKGAFTGALALSRGWFEAADGGTLFLDEIGELPLPAQAKLLRVIQEREVVRVGGRRPIPVDVRFIAATNTKLEHAVAEGRFREDLFYRIHVAPLALAPLRERAGDILPLARHFLAVHAERLALPRAELAPDAVARLLAHTWPGNVRELDNAIHHALLVSHDGVVRAESLELAVVARPPRPVAPPSPSLEDAVLSLLEEDRPNLHDHIEATVFRTVYEACDKNQLRTARLLGLSRNVVRARLAQHGLLAGGQAREADGARGRFSLVADPLSSARATVSSLRPARRSA
jgi:sigma-54-specific transcriptional regulator